MTFMHVICSDHFLPAGTSVKLLEALQERLGPDSIKKLVANDKQDAQQRTIAMVACFNKPTSDRSVELLKYLIDFCGIDINYKCKFGTCLMQAIDANNMDIVRFLIEKLGLSAAQQDENGTSALYMAVFKGNLTMV